MGGKVYPDLLERMAQFELTLLDLSLIHISVSATWVSFSQHSFTDPYAPQATMASIAPPMPGPCSETGI